MEPNPLPESTPLFDRINLPSDLKQLAPEQLPELCAELQHRIDTDAAFKAAFEGLTPGRRREYNLQIAGAKQASTREARVEKYAPKILAGKGMRDR